MRLRSCGLVACLLALLTACASTRASDPPMAAAVAGAGAEPAPDASTPSDSEPSEPDPSAGDGTTQDRCLGGSCGPSRLPEQPELAFLEDMGDGWQRLMELDWQLAPGAEGYRCMTLTVPEDVYITEFFPQVPAGTHHATFGISASAQSPDEVVACGVGNVGERRLQGSGASTDPTALPDGVAMPVRRGEQIFMNLHLFNVGDTTLEGRSGMWIKTVPRAAVVHEAENVLAGPLALEVPVGRSTQTGSCTLRADATVFSIGPHMHQKGVHIRATATTAAGEVVLYDGDYDFTHQVAHVVDDVQLQAGDVVNLECTYENDTGMTLVWGDSSLDEMCFVGLGLYPAIGYGQLPCSS